MTIAPKLSLLYYDANLLPLSPIPTARFCRSQEEVEAARAAAAPGWTGDIAWDEAVTVAMSEEPRNGETQSEREARVLKSVLEADIVPENKLGKVGAQSVRRSMRKCTREKHADDAREVDWRVGTKQSLEIIHRLEQGSPVFAAYLGIPRLLTVLPRSVEISSVNNAWSASTIR